MVLYKTAITNNHKMNKVLITGAAGNLGGLLAEHLLDSKLTLNLLTHKKAVNPKLNDSANVNVFKADLAHKESLKPALHGVDTVIHFAGVLFRHNPEKFLSTTNTQYFKNLIEVAIESNVKRIILISFPHVEGVTTPDNPARGILTGNPISAHATTRLEEEKLLFEQSETGRFEAVSLRLGMVYGRGILMIDAARWFSKFNLLGIWKDPTWIHLISIADYLEATKQAIIKDNIRGIYHIGDEGKQTLQEFLDAATQQWGYRKPIRMHIKLILIAARLFELNSLLFGTKSPLTRDFITIGRVSYYGDTTRMRAELISNLKFRTFKDGIDTL